MSFVLNEKGGGLRRLLSFIGIKGRRESRKNIIAGLISSINVVMSELEDSILRLKKRYGLLVRRAITSILKKENDRALIYANEASQVKRMVTKLIVAEKVLEQVRLRLETIENVSNLPASIMEAANLLVAAKDYVKDVIPSMAYSMENLINEAKKVITETTDAVEFNPSAVLEYDSEARELLKEIERTAEETVKNQLPEIPLTLMATGKGRGLEVRVKESALKLPVPKPRRRRPAPDEIDRAVLEYIITHGGFIDVSDVAAKLGVDKQDIMSSLHRLKEQNKIMF